MSNKKSGDILPIFLLFYLILSFCGFRTIYEEKKTTSIAFLIFLRSFRAAQGKLPGRVKQASFSMQEEEISTADRQGTKAAFRLENLFESVALGLGANVAGRPGLACKPDSSHDFFCRVAFRNRS